MPLDTPKAKPDETKNRKVTLRRELKAGCLRENETNRQLAEEWFLLDEVAWETAEKQ